MNPQDDPEARIRELEQPLSDMARSSELNQHPADYGYVPPTPGAYPPPPTTPLPTLGPGDVTFPSMAPTVDYRTSRSAIVIPVVIAVLALVIGGGIALYLSTQTTPSVPSAGPTFSGGGATLDDRPPSIDRTAPVPGSSIEAPPAGSSTSVAGMGANKVIACNENVVNVSGFENTVVITGRCASVTVSGKDNVVTLDESVVIGVSGFDNRVVFHTGDPQVSNSGFGNTVDQG